MLSFPQPEVPLDPLALSSVQLTVRRAPAPGATRAGAEPAAAPEIDLWRQRLR